MKLLSERNCLGARFGIRFSAAKIAGSFSGFRQLPDQPALLLLGETAGEFALKGIRRPMTAYNVLGRASKELN